MRGPRRVVPLDPTSDNPIQVPIGCFDENENQLGPDDFVIGFTRVYAYTSWTNDEPGDSRGRLRRWRGARTAGLAIPHCTASKLQDCAAYSLDTVVTPDSWVVDPTTTGPGMRVTRRSGSTTSRPRASWTTTRGCSTIRSRADRVETSTNYHPPQAAGTGVIWAVVHDNRGGASWQQVPVSVQ